MSDLHFPRAGFFRRLASTIYDTLVAVAIGMLAALIMIILLTVLIESNVLPKYEYEHVNEVIQANLYYQLIIQLWTVSCVTYFFLWFWKNGGQTLGMRAWRIRIFLIDADDNEVGYTKLLLRFVCSLAGIGTLLVLFDRKHRLAFQDRVSGTQVLLLTKEQNHHKNW